MAVTTPSTRVVILSAPSGAGKTTLAHHLMKALPELAFSVSATTRPERCGEVNGKDYHYMTEAEFKAEIAAGSFVEYEEVYPGRFYGTLHRELERLRAAGRVPVFDVDVHGGLNLKRIFKTNALAIFVEPPSMRVLEKRLRGRGTEDEAEVRTRLKKAAEEMTHKNAFDVVLVNDDLQTAIANVVQRVQQFLAA